jgi:putative transposase
MSNSRQKIYLFVHVIWSVSNRQPLLTRPVRTVLFSHLQKHGEEKGIRIIAINGVEDHVHGLLQMHPAQNLAQVVKSLRMESTRWLNETKLISDPFEWEEEYVALSVNPSSVKQVTEYINKQEEHHKTKTLDNELEVFERVQF